MAFENSQIAQRGEQPLLEFGVGWIQRRDTETFHLNAELFAAFPRLLAVAVGIRQAFRKALDLLPGPGELLLEFLDLRRGNLKRGLEFLKLDP